MRNFTTKITMLAAVLATASLYGLDTATDNIPEGEPAFRVGIFDQNGVQAFVDNHKDLEEEALQLALSERLKALAAHHRTPLVFLHDTTDSSPFIYLAEPVENVNLNAALGQAEEPATGAEPSFPDGPNIGTIQIQHLLDQILENEVVKGQLSEQFNQIQEVKELVQEVEFYEEILNNIDSKDFTDQQVMSRYGIERDELERLGLMAFQKLDAAERQYQQQVTRFYVQLMVQLVFEEAEANGFTHIFQYRNGPTRRLVYNSNARVEDLTPAIAERLNQISLENPEELLESVSEE